MIRAATALWIALAGAVGFSLFQLKHQVHALDEELLRLNRQIAAEHQTIHVLKAEWSYFNQPQRLEALAQRHLDLTPMKPQQLTRIAELPLRPAEDAAIASPPTPPTSLPVGAAVSSAPRPFSGAAIATPTRLPPQARPSVVRAPTSGFRPVAAQQAAPALGPR